MMGKLWGGRFDKETSELVDRFNASIGFDVRLWEYDIEGSIAHARMLGKCGIIPQGDADQIVAGLKGIAEDIGAGKVSFDVGAEDIHMNVEKLLHERIGEVAGKLHTARSRNDQVALDLRMYLKDRMKEMDKAAGELQLALIQKAEEHVETIMPGYTHLQQAQPVTLAHHLMAYVWMLQRDRGRLADCYLRTDVLPLGSGALAGTSFPIDREYVAELLGFSRISENSMDAVSDRDFAVEFLSVCAIMGMHLSRFAEEIVIWNSREFGFVELDDSVATGSSLMPQKKNPDVAELLRGKTGRLYGDLISLLTVLKGLPLTYNKDLQEDKEPIFDAVDTILKCLQAAKLLVETTKFRADVMERALEGSFANSTDIADGLVRQGIPFRKAHEIVGQSIKSCVTGDKAESDMKGSVEARNIPGGTSSEQVRKQIEAAKRAVAECGI